jgi:hypothetical protein
MVKDLVVEWLKRIHHSAHSVNKEYSVTGIFGASIPFWVVSMEAHTYWKGLVKRQVNPKMELSGGSSYLAETGNFRRSYRWCVSARKNICEHWGMTNLHEPQEPVSVSWDGFPLDSTFSRGRLDEKSGTRELSNGDTVDVPAYDVREYFEFKYANGLPIHAIQVDEEEALRRAKSHIQEYHLKLARLHCDILIDHRTELEIAGIQLFHLPFWYSRYVYRPRNILRHFQSPREKNVIIDGYSNGILKGELAIARQDKLWINSIITGIVSFILFFFGLIWHPSFLLISIVFLAISLTSGYLSFARKNKDDTFEGSSNFQGLSKPKPLTN